MSDWSYILGNIHKAIEVLLSDKPQEERVSLACTHIFNTPEAAFDSALSSESKKHLANIQKANANDPESVRLKIMALSSFLVSAIQDTAKKCRDMYPPE